MAKNKEKLQRNLLELTEYTHMLKITRTFIHSRSRVSAFPIFSRISVLLLGRGAYPSPPRQHLVFLSLTCFISLSDRAGTNADFN